MSDSAVSMDSYLVVVAESGDGRRKPTAARFFGCGDDEEEMARAVKYAERLLQDPKVRRTSIVRRTIHEAEVKSFSKTEGVEK